MNTNEKLKKLRDIMEVRGLAAYMQPVHDAFMSEYPPACNQRVAWLSGFTGSAGMVVVTQDEAVLFTDGRYTLQAAQQLDTALFQVINSGETHPASWLARALPSGDVGYDPLLFTKPMLAKYPRTKPCDNLVDDLWVNRPAAPATNVFLHDEKFAGESAKNKCARMAKLIAEKKADALFLASPESINWLLNIRARDVECTPLALCTGLLHADGSVVVFLDPARVAKPMNNVVFVAPENMAEHFQHYVNKKIWVDEEATPVAYVQMLAGAEIIASADPCLLARARKNAVQVQNIRDIHVEDGVAIAKLLHWLDAKNNANEREVVEQLQAFRAQHESFVEPSFATIAGGGANGAIVHYRADENSNRTLQNGELFLLDSGGQYPQGTTDITRTIAVGEPTAEHKDRFTRVLKGHIALATVSFPKGTRGSQLDSLARQFLWQVGVDYDHGTGHGVGQFLGVHEGPQRISKRGGDAPLEVGMVVSNEPGFYKTGEYGIRIENLVVVVEKGQGFLGFETLTCAPIDRRLVEVSLLSVEEKKWLNAYHAWVEKMLSPLLPEAEKSWLKQACAAV